MRGTRAIHLDLAIFYVFLALGMLAKGPVAPLLAAVIIGLFATAKHDFRLLLRTLWIPGYCSFARYLYPGMLRYRFEIRTSYASLFSNTTWRDLAPTYITTPNHSGISYQLR